MTIRPTDHLIQVHSPVMPDPVLGPLGRPDPNLWIATSVDTHRHGWFRLVLDGEDVSWFRGVPAKIVDFGNGEPFDDDKATVAFPQVSDYEARPSFLRKWSPVEIEWVERVGGVDTVTDTLFEGHLAGVNSGRSQTTGELTFDCLGALYELDLNLSQPPLGGTDDLVDVGEIVAREMQRRPWLRINGIVQAETGILYHRSGGWEPLLGGVMRDALAMAVDDQGRQWTLMKQDGRVAVMRLKDRTSLHFVTSNGAKGVSHELYQDWTTEPNVQYGSGTDDARCSWRNAKYPNLQPDAAPVWPGAYIGGGSPAATTIQVQQWQYGMQARGYGGIRTDGIYDATSRAYCRDLQTKGGLLVDGIVGPQTWALTFQTGSNGGDFSGAFVMPLAWYGKPQPWLWNPDGSVIGPNPDFDPINTMRVERYSAYGPHVSLVDGIDFAVKELLRDNSTGNNWLGTITFENVDPENDWAWRIRSGSNLLYRNFDGTDVLFHVAHQKVEPPKKVTLTVDTLARDLPTVRSILTRNRDTTDAARRLTPTYRNSKQVEDRFAEWDCESPAGIIPYHGIQARLWNVLRIPFSARGDIVGLELYAAAPARMALALFDGRLPISHQYLVSKMASPLDLLDDGTNPWDGFPEEAGLVDAWGEPGSALGYYPYKEDSVDPSFHLVGAFKDNASFNFESQMSPWMYVAIWCDTTTFIHGRFHPGPGS